MPKTDCYGQGFLVWRSSFLFSIPRYPWRRCRQRFLHTVQCRKIDVYSNRHLVVIDRFKLLDRTFVIHIRIAFRAARKTSLVEDMYPKVTPYRPRNMLQDGPGNSTTACTNKASIQYREYQSEDYYNQIACKQISKL